ncbi:MAG: SH3 domain-containing protein, partial [Povalibacter sp.]
MLKRGVWFGVLLAALAGCASAPRDQAIGPVSSIGVIGVQSAQLDADYWIAHAARANATLLDTNEIASQNSRLLQMDKSVRDIEHLPTSLAADEVRKWIQDLSARPERTLFDEEGRELPAQSVDEWMSTLNLESVPATQATRYGLVVKRADLRTFPTTVRVFSSTGDTDIDRFQESAVFPGTPVVIAHASRDGRWLFVVS